MPKAPSRATKPAASPEPDRRGTGGPQAAQGSARTAKPEAAAKPATAAKPAAASCAAAKPAAKARAGGAAVQAVTGAAFGDDWWQRGVVYQVYPRSLRGQQ